MRLLIFKVLRAGGILTLSLIAVAFAASEPAKPVSLYETQKMTASHKANGELYATYPTPDYGTGEKRALIERGEYLAKAGDCIACHTNATEGGAAFAGGLPIKTPFGTFYTPNITADPETGIGKWSDQDFIRAMRDGVDPQGKNYFPAFPYTYFNKVHPEDSLAIKAYLFSIPKVKQQNKDNTLPFPINWRFLQLGWKILFFYPYRGEFQYDAKQSPEWNRGAYLVDGLGHCSMCHTPLNILGAPKRAYYLTGGFIDGFWAPNITHSGLKGASHQDIVAVFKENKLIHEAGKVIGPMADVNHDSLRYLTDEDLKAMAIYLLSVKSKEVNWAAKLEKVSSSKAGKKVFEEKCIMCHGEGNEHRAGAAPAIGNQANWVMRLKQGLPTLYEHTINGYNSMPAMGNCPTCSQENIRSAVNYIIAKSLTMEDERRALMEPAPKKLTREDGKRIYDENCAACHNTGKQGAPKLGDKAAWKPLIAQNMDTLIRRTINGIHGTHVRGDCKECTNNELIAAVKYLVDESTAEGDYSLW